MSTSSIMHHHTTPYAAAAAVVVAAVAVLSFGSLSLSGSDQPDHQHRPGDDPVRRGPVQIPSRRRWPPDRWLSGARRAGRARTAEAGPLGEPTIARTPLRRRGGQRGTGRLSGLTRAEMRGAPARGFSGGGGAAPSSPRSMGNTPRSARVVPPTDCRPVWSDPLDRDLTGKKRPKSWIMTRFHGTFFVRTAWIALESLVSRRCRALHQAYGALPARVRGRDQVPVGVDHGGADPAVVHRQLGLAPHDLVGPPGPVHVHARAGSRPRAARGRTGSRRAPGRSRS